MAAQRYDCVGEFALRGNASTVDALSFGGAPLTHYALENGVVTSRGRRARTAGGDSIDRLTVRRTTDGRGEAALTLTLDFAPLRAAIGSVSWPDAPFDRIAMRAALGLGPRAACCGDAAGLAAPEADLQPALPLPAQAAEFQSHCAACHRTAERSPPNFLTGDTERVTASLTQCAPRIFVRLSMWQTPADAREKVPMPPPQASRGGGPAVQTAPDPAIPALRNIVAGWLRSETGRAPDVAEMLMRGYENLRPCLPPDG
jgi:mono/diheme cytochrome c family protein